MENIMVDDRKDPPENAIVFTQLQKDDQNKIDKEIVDTETRLVEINGVLEKLETQLVNLKQHLLSFNNQVRTLKANNADFNSFQVDITHPKKMINTLNRDIKNMKLSQDRCFRKIKNLETRKTKLINKHTRIFYQALAQKKRIAKKEAIEKEKIAKKLAMKTAMKNGTSKPRPGTVCDDIWQICNALSKKGYVRIKDVRMACMGKNENTITSQYYRWRKYNGVVGYEPIQINDAVDPINPINQESFVVPGAVALTVPTV